MVGSINDQVANFDVKVDLEVKLETKLYKGLKNPQIVPRQSVLPCPHVDNPLSSCQPPVEKMLSQMHVASQATQKLCQMIIFVT